MLSVDTRAKPVLFRPGGRDDGSWKAEPQCVLGDGERLLDRFCEALSLAANTYVNRNGQWMDYGDLTAFGFRKSGLSAGTLQLDTPALSTIRLDQRTLGRAWDIHRLRHRGAKNQNSVGTAIDRWMRSMNPRARFSDQFIELRIALEALFLDGFRGELRFRLALHGALDLESTSARREACFRLLQKAYDLGSTAVHTGFVKQTEAHLKVLHDARDACREGILKRLARGSTPDWRQLVLGHPAGGST